jgi:hypothetical protein
MYSFREHFRHLSRRPWLAFLPFLALYIALILFFHKDAMEGDEGRYVFFAENLSKGYYSPMDEINLWNGPGYPLVLTPLVVLKLPYIFFTLLNAAFLYIALVIIFKELRVLSSRIVAFAVTTFFGLYYIAWDELVKILTEPFSILLISLFAMASRQSFQNTAGWRKSGLAGFILGCICLTKIIFGPIILVLLPFFALAFLATRKATYYVALKITAIALLTTSPYLFYTYNLTGKFPYWGNSGGSSLYSMSSPHPREYGNWIPPSFILESSRTQPDEVLRSATNNLQENHKDVIEKLSGKTAIEQDEILFREGMNNIKQHPIKFFQNWLANISRMFFFFPFSYYEHNLIPLIYLLPNSFVFVMICLTIPAGIVLRTLVPPYVKYLLLVALLYLAASSVLSAYPRQLYVILPLIFLWSSCSLQKVVEAYLKIVLSFPKPDSP